MQSMTPHEINIAIGKSLGIEQCSTAMCQGFPPELCYRKDTYIGELPDFYGSLDRMHEVERSLSTTAPIHNLPTRSSYLDNLAKITGDYAWEMVHSTSQQRAEAYLRTLNLWTNTNVPSRQDVTVSNPPPSM